MKIWIGWPNECNIFIKNTWSQTIKTPNTRIRVFTLYLRNISFVILKKKFNNNHYGKCTNNNIIIVRRFTVSIVLIAYIIKYFTN